MHVMGKAAVIIPLIVLAVGAATQEVSGIEKAAMVGLIALVFLLGLSAWWLSGRRRMMVVIIPVVGLIVLAVASTMYWLDDIHVAAAVVGLIAQALLLGLAAGWLSREPRMRAIGAAALIVFLIALDVAGPAISWLDRIFGAVGYVVLTPLVVAEPAITWGERMFGRDIFDPAIIVVLIGLVLLLVMAAQRWSRERRVRVTGVVILFFGLMLLGGVSESHWSDRIKPRLCPESERIATAEQALEFGKRHLREDEGFWRGLNATTREEIEEILQSERCCAAGKGDYFINGHSRWGVVIASYKSGYQFHYVVNFGECGKQVRVQKWAAFL